MNVFSEGAKVNNLYIQKPIKTVIATFSDWAYYKHGKLSQYWCYANVCKPMKNYDNTCNVIPQYWQEIHAPLCLYFTYIDSFKQYSSILGQPQNEYFTNIAKDCNMSGHNSTTHWWLPHWIPIWR